MGVGLLGTLPPRGGGSRRALNSSIENYDDALVLLIAEVATAYVDYRTVEQRLAFARGNAEMQAESARIAELD